MISRILSAWASLQSTSERIGAFSAVDSILTVTGDVAVEIGSECDFYLRTQPRCRVPGLKILGN